MTNRTPALIEEAGGGTWARWCTVDRRTATGLRPGRLPLLFVSDTAWVDVYVPDALHDDLERFVFDLKEQRGGPGITQLRRVLMLDLSPAALALLVSVPGAAAAMLAAWPPARPGPV